MPVVVFSRRLDHRRVRPPPPPSHLPWVPVAPLFPQPPIPCNYIIPCPSSPFLFTANIPSPTLPNILTLIRLAPCITRLLFPFRPPKMACIIQPTLSQPQPPCPLRILLRGEVIIRACILMLAHITGTISRIPNEYTTVLYYRRSCLSVLSCCYLNISCIPSIYFIPSLTL